MAMKAILGTIKWSNHPNEWRTEVDTVLALVMQASASCMESRAFRKAGELSCFFLWGNLKLQCQMMHLVVQESGFNFWENGHLSQPVAWVP